MSLLVESLRLDSTNQIVFLIFERTNQVDTLLNRAYRCNLVVDFHRTVRAKVVGIHSILVRDRPIKELALRPYDLVINSAVANIEVLLPTVSKVKVFFGRRERLSGSLLNRCTRLC